MVCLVLSAMGPDQPGLVDALTDSLVHYQANVADSRMINLGGKFALVMLIELPDDQADRLTAQLPDEVRRIGLRLMIDPAGDAEPRAGVPFRVHAYAMDQPGLVHRITHLLHTLQVNIEQMDSRLEHAAHSGTPLFSMDLLVTVPDTLTPRRLREQLESLCAELNCDVEMRRA